MKYHFEFGFDGARMMLITLNPNDLQAMWADDEDSKSNYRDLTIAFNINRYLRLYAMVAAIDRQDPHFGRVHMSASIDSRSATAAGQKIRGGHIEIYAAGGSGFNVWWWDDYSLYDYGIELKLPPECQQHPAAWFEAQTGQLELEERNICNVAYLG